MPDRPRVYAYSGCGTCRKAIKWLNEHGIAVDVIAIREHPPTKAELKLALEQLQSVRALFNTSGGDYKSMNLKERLPQMSEAEALKLLATNGNLVKRPFVVLPKGVVVVGFAEQSYSSAFE